MKKCQPRDHSLGQALPPGFVAPTRIVWLDLRWICPLCLPLVLQLFWGWRGGAGVEGGVRGWGWGGAYFFPSWAAGHSLPFPRGKSLRPACSVLQAALRGAMGVPVIHLSRDVALGPIGREDSPFPGDSEILLEC